MPSTGLGYGQRVAAGAAREQRTSAKAENAAGSSKPGAGTRPGAAGARREDRAGARGLQDEWEWVKKCVSDYIYGQLVFCCKQTLSEPGKAVAILRLGCVLLLKLLLKE